MPVIVTPRNCNGGSRARRALTTEFGVFIAPTNPDYGAGFAQLSTVATTTAGRTQSKAHTAGTYSNAISFLENTATEWAHNDTYPPLRPDAVTVYVHPDRVDELDVLDIIYQKSRTHHARTNPDEDAPF